MFYDPEIGTFAFYHKDVYIDINNIISYSVGIIILLIFLVCFL